jgi:hypothetical protein
MSDLARRYPPRKDGPGPLSLPSVERKQPKPLKKVNRERRAARNAITFGVQAKACRRLPCCVCARRPSDPAHVRSRGAGGTDSDCVPLCSRCHREQHDKGIETFQKKHNIVLEVVAAELAAAIKQHNCEAWATALDGGLRVLCSLCERECGEPTP